LLDSLVGVGSLAGVVLVLRLLICKMDVVVGIYGALLAAGGGMGYAKVGCCVLFWNQVALTGVD